MTQPTALISMWLRPTIPYTRDDELDIGCQDCFVFPMVLDQNAR